MTDMTPEPPANPIDDPARAARQAREALGETLDQIEDRFDVKKRTSEMVERARRSYDENPVPWLVGATAAVIAVGGLVAWALFSDD